MGTRETQTPRSNNRTAELSRQQTSARAQTLVSVPMTSIPSGIYLGTITAQGVDGPAGEQRYSVDLYGGWSKAATGLDVGFAMVADDTAAVLPVGLKVYVTVPNNSGPPMIIPVSGGGSGATSGFRFGYTALNEAGD